MDNCVFQIETALLKFDGMDESEDGKSSVVKRYVDLHFFSTPGWRSKPHAKKKVIPWDAPTAIDRADIRSLSSDLNS